MEPGDQEIPQERMQTVDVPVPQAMEEIVGALEPIPQECVKQCTVKQTDYQNKQQLQDNQQRLARQAARQEIGNEREDRKEENKKGERVRTLGYSSS